MLHTSGFVDTNTNKGDVLVALLWTPRLHECIGVVRLNVDVSCIPSPQGGQQCVKRIATATSLLRTQIQRWRKDPSQAEEIAEEVELKSVADIQNEIDKTVTSSKLLENEFQADAEGENYRKIIANASLLQVHVLGSY